MVDDYYDVCIAFGLWQVSNKVNRNVLLASDRDQKQFQQAIIFLLRSLCFPASIAVSYKSSDYVKHTGLVILLL